MYLVIITTLSHRKWRQSDFFLVLSRFHWALGERKEGTCCNCLTIEPTHPTKVFSQRRGHLLLVTRYGSRSCTGMYIRKVVPELRLEQEKQTCRSTCGAALLYRLMASDGGACIRWMDACACACACACSFFFFFFGACVESRYYAVQPSGTRSRVRAG